MDEVGLGKLGIEELSTLEVIGSIEVTVNEDSEELEMIVIGLVTLEIVSVTESELISLNDDDDVSTDEVAVISLDTDELGICVAEVSVMVVDEELNNESLEAPAVADESIAVDDDMDEVVSVSALDWVIMTLISEDGSRVVVEEGISEKSVSN